MSTPWRVSIAFPTVCVLAMASSCATTTETVEGEDGSAFALAARARIPTASEPRANAAGVTTTSEVRVEVSTASGSDAQDVEAGHQLDFGGLFVPGPARVASDFEARELDVVFAPTVALDASMSFTPSFGLVLVEREVRLRSGAQSGRDDARGYGFDLGLELEWRAPSSSFVAYGAFRGALLVGDGSGMERRTIELGVGWWFDPHVALRAGWRHWNWREDPGAGSELDYTLAGPVVTLDVRL